MSVTLSSVYVTLGGLRPDITLGPPKALRGYTMSLHAIGEPYAKSLVFGGDVRLVSGVRLKLRVR